ncbi:hypothetical protein M3J09_007587 [Ascochyta lentis]
MQYGGAFQKSFPPPPCQRTGQSGVIGPGFHDVFSFCFLSSILLYPTYPIYSIYSIYFYYASL